MEFTPYIFDSLSTTGISVFYRVSLVEHPTFNSPLELFVFIPISLLR